jgi:hypothetical protein
VLRNGAFDKDLPKQILSELRFQRKIQYKCHRNHINTKIPELDQIAYSSNFWYSFALNNSINLVMEILLWKSKNQLQGENQRI